MVHVSLNRLFKSSTTCLEGQSHRVCLLYLLQDITFPSSVLSSVFYFRRSRVLKSILTCGDAKSMTFNWFLTPEVDGFLGFNCLDLHFLHVILCFYRSQIPPATLCTQRKMQRKENSHSPQKTMICLKFVLRVNHPWVSMAILSATGSDADIVSTTLRCNQRGQIFMLCTDPQNMVCLVCPGAK